MTIKKNDLKNSNKSEVPCKKCWISRNNENYSYCPYCGRKFDRNDIDKII